MSDDKTISVYDAQASKYDTLVSRDAPDADLQAFIDAMPAGGHALDLGCGPGNSAAMMQAAGLKVTAMDASAEMIRIARERYGIAAIQGRFDDLKDIDTYDGVWANFSLLHAPKADMPRHLSAIHTALKPGGLFHIGTKIGTGEHRDSIGRKYSYYETDELAALLKEAGFTPRSTRHGREKGLSGEMADFVIILCDA